MLIRVLSRYGAPLFIAALVAGCGSSEKSSFSRGSISGGAVKADSACVAKPSSCIYKGKYEKGERSYAEDEAKRLNRAQLERLRRIAASQ